MLRYDTVTQCMWVMAAGRKFAFKTVVKLLQIAGYRQPIETRHHLSNGTISDPLQRTV